MSTQTPDQAAVSQQEHTKALVDSTRTHQIDKWFRSDVSTTAYRNQLFVRLIAKKRRFVSVDFTYSIFEASYLRDCVFDSCDFTGCRFVGTNLHESTFSGCVFDYATFERTFIDPAVLDTECPAYENLKMRFARSLRVNFQQLGDAAAANKAVAVELAASEVHLHKAWRSNERYYRKKYKGLQRGLAFVHWFGFRTLDFLWGNGESPAKLLRSALIIIAVIAGLDALAWRDPTQLSNFRSALWDAPQVFLGVLSPPAYPVSLLAVITLARLLMIGMFLSILIKRFSRR